VAAQKQEPVVYNSQLVILRFVVRKGITYHISSQEVAFCFLS